MKPHIQGKTITNNLTYKKEKRPSVFLTKKVFFPVEWCKANRTDSLFSHSTQGWTTYTLQPGLGNNALEARVKPKLLGLSNLL